MQRVENPLSLRASGLQQQKNTLGIHSVLLITALVSSFWHAVDQVFQLPANAVDTSNICI